MGNAMTPPPRKTEITRADLLPMSVYEKERKQRRQRMAALKRDRRIEVGPFTTFYFESYDTMLHQVHEMLCIEKGGDAQIQDELDAYNPMVPKGSNLVATVMFEIEDPERRARELAGLGGAEDCFHIVVEGRRIRGRPIGDEARTRADGKTSSVHFIRFDLAPEDIAAFRRPGAEILVEIAHPNYGHLARLGEAARAALAGDLA
jgi:hypothetical protein